jgi:N6-adenosine-specific RNA methylase IME4
MIRIKRASHSDKPDYFKRMIEKWYPKEAKLEMFCRNHTPLFENDNWDVFGNEVDGSIELNPS